MSHDRFYCVVELNDGRPGRVLHVGNRVSCKSFMKAQRSILGAAALQLLELPVERLVEKAAKRLSPNPHAVVVVQRRNGRQQLVEAGDLAMAYGIMGSFCSQGEVAELSFLSDADLLELAVDSSSPPQLTPERVVHKRSMPIPAVRRRRRLTSSV